MCFTWRVMLAGSSPDATARKPNTGTRDFSASLMAASASRPRLTAPPFHLIDFPPSITKLRARLSMGSTTFAIWSSQTVQTKALRSAVKATHGVSLRAFPEPLAWVSIPHVAIQNSCVLRVTLSFVLTQASRSMPSPGFGLQTTVVILCQKITGPRRQRVTRRHVRADHFGKPAQVECLSSDAGATLRTAQNFGMVLGLNRGVICKRLNGQLSTDFVTNSWSNKLWIA